MTLMVTVITQINVRESKDIMRASVWVAKGDTVSDPEGPYPEENPDAIRFSGPLPFELAKETQAKLKTLFEFLGYEVQTDSFPDD
jgi:hypothetical protein